MGFLRKIIFSLLLTGIFLSVSGQDFAARKEAFQKSYASEASGNYTAAIGALKGIYDEKSYEINLRLGWLSYLAGNMADSKNYYSKAISIMPYSVEAKMGLAYPLSSMGSINELITVYEDILKMVPNYSVVMHRLGLIYYNRGEYDKALKYFDKVVNLWPFDYDGLTMLAWTYFRLNNAREARVLFQKALLNNPAGSSALEGLGLLK
jgi:tetratricopeptide (TPR) repeat protein